MTLQSSTTHKLKKKHSLLLGFYFNTSNIKHIVAWSSTFRLINNTVPDTLDISSVTNSPSQTFLLPGLAHVTPTAPDRPLRVLQQLVKYLDPVLAGVPQRRHHGTSSPAGRPAPTEADSYRAVSSQQAQGVWPKCFESTR